MKLNCIHSAQAYLPPFVIKIIAAELA
jgi:hypothetical protein